MTRDGHAAVTGDRDIAAVQHRRHARLGGDHVRRIGVPGGRHLSDLAPGPSGQRPAQQRPGLGAAALRRAGGGQRENLPVDSGQGQYRTARVGGAGWCQDPAGRPVLLVTGGGGSGKTRLGREACVQMLVAGWDAGLGDDRRRDGAATDRLQRSTLLVVDDADLCTGLISALVDYLRWDDAGPPVALLLLARAAGGWWDRLVRQQDLADSYTVLDLDRHPVPPADRAEHFRRASAAFAAYRGPQARQADAPPAAELEDPAYAEPLLIHIAALLRTVDTSATLPPGPSEERPPEQDSTTGQPGLPVRQALLKALCQRERDRCQQLGEESHLFFNPDLRVDDQMVALATLTAAADQPSATSLLAALPNQAEVTRIGAEALAAWAHRLYAGPGYWNPLRPDLLAEQHLADTADTAQLSHLATTAAELAAGQRWETRLLTQLLAELTRAAPNQPALRAALSELLAAALPRIVDLAVTAGHAELADLASLALQLAPQPGLAASLAGQMPEHSVQLAALAATLTSQQVTLYRAGAIDGQPDAADRLARSLNNLSVRLGDLGQWQDALAVSEEAVAAYRELAAASPDRYRPDLARSLHYLGERFFALRRPAEALPPAQEAVKIYRELDAASPDDYRPDLADSLDYLGAWLSELHRPAEALPLTEEAVKIYRELTAASPDRYRPGLARSLDHLGIHLSEVGRPDEALPPAQEAVEIHRELAAASPDQYRHGLARSLGNLGILFSELGRPAEALPLTREAVEISRELAAAVPGQYRRDLAHSLGNLGNLFSELGRPAEALPPAQEAVEISRELAAAVPGQYRPDLAHSLGSLGIYLSKAGRPDEALPPAREAVKVYRELAAARPDPFRPGLAMSLNTLSLLLADLDRPEDALAAIQEATGIYRELATARPDAFRPGLAMSLNTLSIYLGELGRREDALTAIQEAVTIRRELAARWPDAHRHELEQSLRVAAWLEHGEGLSDASPWEPKQ